MKWCVMRQRAVCAVNKQDMAQGVRAPMAGAACAANERRARLGARVAPSEILLTWYQTQAAIHRQVIVVIVSAKYRAQLAAKWPEIMPCRQRGLSSSWPRGFERRHRRIERRRARNHEGEQLAERLTSTLWRRLMWPCGASWHDGPAV